MENLDITTVLLNAPGWGLLYLIWRDTQAGNSKLADQIAAMLEHCLSMLGDQNETH